MPGGVDLHQGPLNVASHLGHAAPRRLRQHPLLNGQRHRSRHVSQAASHQGRLGRIQHPAPLHDLRGVKAHVHQGAAVIHDLPGPAPGYPQAGRQQAGGVEPALLVTDHRRDPTIRPPLTGVGRQLTTSGQARRRQGLTPRSPRRQTVTGRSQLPQTHSPQAKQPSAAGLLQGHDPTPLSASHQCRIVPTVTSEQGRCRIAVSDGALTTATVVVGVLGGDQQAGQQPLDHTGQCPARGQRPQQTRHVLSAGHGPRRHVLGGCAQRPGRTTGRDTRKHTTFEHMYSIARLPTTRTLKQSPRITGTAAKTQGTNFPGRRRTEAGQSSQSGLTPTPKPAHPNWPTGSGKPVRELRSGRPSSRTQVQKGWVRGYGAGRAGSGEQVRADQFRNAGSRRLVRVTRYSNRFERAGSGRPDPTYPNSLTRTHPLPDVTRLRRGEWSQHPRPPGSRRRRSR